MKINWKAVVWGVLTGWAVTSLFIMIMFITSAALHGDINAFWDGRFRKNPIYNGASVIAIFVPFLCGGWVIANIARKEEIKHAAVAGLISILIGIMVVIRVLDGYSLPINSYEWLQSAIPTYILGAYARSRFGYKDRVTVSSNEPPIPEP